MTRKQKYIIAILAIVNVAVILALIAIMTRPAPTRPHIPLIILPQDDCQWSATQLLAQAGLGGTVTLTTDASLNLKIIYPLAPGQEADDAAQEIWTAFDIALALYEQGCSTFTQVQVTILAHNTQINASVNTSDLIAYSSNELSQEEFIDRVIYTLDTTAFTVSYHYVLNFSLCPHKSQPQYHPTQTEHPQPFVSNRSGSGA